MRKLLSLPDEGTENDSEKYQQNAEDNIWAYMERLTAQCKNG
jgi:hypothetical protein